MVDIVIQIVNYNTKKYLPDCINGVINDLKNSDSSYRITVLDNGSSDDLSDLERKYKSENIEFYYSDKNLGFGAGHNLLFKRAKSKYILILNPDVKFLEKNIIERLIVELEKNVKNKVIGPKLITAKGEPQEWDHGEISGLLAWLLNNTGNSFWKNRDEKCRVSWVSGAFFLIGRDVLRDVGGFDENFFLYKEEEDLCLRIRKLGWKVIYDPSIRVFHYGSVMANKDEFMDESRDYFIKKHFKDKFYYPILKLIAKIIVK